MTKTTAEAQRLRVPHVAGTRVVPPGPAREADLKWQRQPMVRWFSPSQLAATAVRAVLSSVFGAYADRREVQAALHEHDPERARQPGSITDGYVFRYADRLHGEDGFWIDYTADLGDGFDSTYGVAWLLSQPTLPKPASGRLAAVDRKELVAAGANPKTPEHCTRRGNLLVLGGDQVYPTSSREEYANRFTGPYQAALPWSSGEGEPQHLYAIPGNHDWYDGLTAFMRLFCQQRWIGGRKTQQSRSYFALELPGRWWLLGVDVQLQSDFDKPQIEYFCRVAREMEPGDRVILCTPEPTWVHAETDPTAFDNLAFFEKTVLAPRGAELALTLSGDLHHYARYTDAVRPERQKHHKITAGGGGAYLLGTQLLPLDLQLRSPGGEAASGRAPGVEASDAARERYTQEALYPDRSTSLRMKWGALSLFWKNPSFAFFLGCVYALYAWFLQSASKASAAFTFGGSDSASFDGSFMDLARDEPISGIGEVFRAYWEIAAHSPPVFMFGLLFVVGLIAFTKPDTERLRLLRRFPRLQTAVRVGLGGLHGVAHIALNVGLIWVFSWFNLMVLGMPGDSLLQVGLFVAEMGVVGGLAGAVLMSLFLLPYVNYNEAFSAQHLEGYKNFVRMHIAPDGTLTVYPYGVDEPTRWDFHPNAKPGEPFFDPRKSPEIRLVDGPITLAAPAAR